jgi:hypothetical protein
MVSRAVLSLCFKLEVPDRQLWTMLTVADKQTLRVRVVELKIRRIAACTFDCFRDLRSLPLYTLMLLAIKAGNRPDSSTAALPGVSPDCVTRRTCPLLWLR